MTRLPVWYWIAIAYLIATLAYNVGTLWSRFSTYPPIDQFELAANLTCKSLGLLLLLFRRGEGVYLLAIAFLVGLAGLLGEFYVDGDWTYLPLVNRIGTVNGFLISFAIIVYMAALKRSGILRRRRAPDAEVF